jgi:CDGSH-type Zn-finger protein/truncated hemoglobin YjbI
MWMPSGRDVARSNRLVYEPRSDGVSQVEESSGGRAQTAGRGKLAQVIATRGGTAAPEEPFVIEHREALIFMLCEAAELEHAIMCQYLFASFSMKQTTDEGLSATELEAVDRWRKVIGHVASDEMLHLALVQNVLSAIGAAPHLSRPSFPQPANHYPAGVQFALLPFGEPALRHFMFLERPEGMTLDDSDGFAAVRRADPQVGPGEIVPRLQDFATVGHLYRSIEAGLAHLAEKLGEDALFVGDPATQATSEYFPWPELITVTDLASASRAMEEILDQGEGPRGDWQNAHFGRFVAILDEYQAIREGNPEFEPTRPVLTCSVRPGERPSDVPLITDAITARCADLFNVGYEVILLTLERFFAHTEESDSELRTLAGASLQLMLQMLRPLGQLISTLPVGPEFPDQTAGASFELFYEGDYLMPHRKAAWSLLEERLRETATFCSQVQSEAGGAISERIAPVATAVATIADSLGEHIAEWMSPRPLAGDTGRPLASTFDPSVTSALLARVEELRNSADNASGPQTWSLSSLFEDTAVLVRDSLDRADSDGQQSVDIATQLVESVLRPMANMLREGWIPDEAKELRSKSVDPDTSVEDRLWEVAKLVTTLRCQADSPAPMIEATAALQQLTLRFSTDQKGPARLAELRDLQVGLRPGIQTMTDGPYLVTNAESIWDYLGLPLATTPQVALCRCGESADKPFCDGTHARIGFSGTKDPNRVLDRRDTYPGEQATIFDNRGICAHSGFCTDRLASVFHTESDPFVTPSGGRLDEIIRAVRSCPSGALSYAFGDTEAREQVDQKRASSIEVSKDGPYRVTGGLPLTDAADSPEHRAEGASLEHYSLCRCGHSQNKPFCSGMHWYVEFRDPLPDPNQEPTIFEWAGGLPALTRMTRVFYEKYVPQDALLAPLFATMPADHPERVAKWLGEVFGGPKDYSGEYGGYRQMLLQHVGKCLSEEQRARWVTLLMQSAKDAGLPNDAEFRSAFAAYIEWGSRLAVENSQSTSVPPEHMPMPYWDWNTAAGPPGSRGSATQPAEENLDAIVLPGPDEIVSFATHIKPLFRQRDRQSMRFAFDLWSYDDVKTHTSAILERLNNGTMPCDGAWSPEWVQVFRRWTDTGKPA